MLKKFLKDESGATAIEYGLLAALIGTAIVGIGTSFGDSLSAGFTQIGSDFGAQATISGGGDD
jgi:pilus assembly protein Flp/PilA